MCHITIPVSHALADLYRRVQDMPDYLEDGAKIACEWKDNEYRHYMRDPIVLMIEEHEEILTIAQVQADDLLAAVKRYRKAIKKAKEYS